MRSSLVLALALSGCASTSEMALMPPAHVYHSERSAAVVADCILDRVTAPELRPRRSEQDGAIVVSFTSADALIRPPPAVYAFTIRSSGSGSVTEARRLGKASLVAAETCF